MSWVVRRRVRLGDSTTGNVSKTGASVSKKIGRRVTINSRGRYSVRVLKGISFRGKLW